MGRGLLSEDEDVVAGTYLGAAEEPEITQLVEDSDAPLLLGMILSDTNFAISRKKVGMGSISIEPFVFRLSCTNDLVVSKEQSFRRHPHMRLSIDELRKGTALAISIGFKVAASVLDAFLKAREEPVADPVETIRQLTEARKLPRKFADR
jgi:hypothetical protein